MPNLQEPDWKSLRIDDVQEFWQQRCLGEAHCVGAQGRHIGDVWCLRMRRRKVLDQYPAADQETWALLGRVDKDAWVAAWRQPGNTPEQIRDEAAYEDASLRTAIDSYANGYRRNPSHYYSGINALMLMHLHRHLTNDLRFDREITTVAGAV